MGNSLVSEPPHNNPNPKQIPPKETVDPEYVPVGDKNESIVGTPIIVKSNISGLELEEYIVSNRDSPIEVDVSLYKLRSSSYSKSIAVVYHHRVIDEKSKTFRVRTEKMKGRLNEIEGLTFMEGLVIFESACGGFAELVSHAKSSFLIS